MPAGNIAVKRSSIVFVIICNASDNVIKAILNPDLFRGTFKTDSNI